MICGMITSTLNERKERKKRKGKDGGRKKKKSI